METEKKWGSKKIFPNPSFCFRAVSYNIPKPPVAFWNISLANARVRHCQNRADARAAAKKSRKAFSLRES